MIINAFDYFFEHTANLEKDLVLGNKETVSYRDLYSDCLKLSGWLSGKFGSGNNIFILSENSVFWIRAYLAIMKSGNICVPLNPVTEEGTLGDLIKRTSATLVFASKRYQKKLATFPVSVITPETEDEWKSEGIQKNRPEIDGRFNEQELAEIIFTSGSTGEQKGVMLTHRNLIANTDSILEYLRLDENDTIEIVMPFYYCYGLSLLHTHLRVGGSVVLDNSFVFIGSVINDLNKYKCTGFSGVPSHFQILLRKTKNFKNTEFETLRYVTQAGGKLHNAFIHEFIDAFPDIKFFVMYGQTEATARLSYLPPELLSEKIGSIGKGIPGVELRVVNEKGKEVQPGEIGEIIARGANIMKGYFNDRQSTKKTIRDDWLYTGDMATVDEEGFMYITNRVKEIIKVRGIRISPKEVEEVIVSYPGVIDCSIMAVDDEIAGEALKAIVYVNDGEQANFNEEDIRRHCADRLAVHKVPQSVEFEAELEFNAAGKKRKR